jgi:hypothetical protein
VVPGEPARTVTESVYNRLLGETFRPERYPVLAAHGDRLYLGIAPERCLDALDPGGEALERSCHPEDDPPALPDSLKDAFRALDDRIRAVGGTLAVPERYPPFDRLHLVGGRLAFRAVLDDDLRALDVVEDGGRLRRVLLPRGVRVFTGGRSLLLARELLEGTAFAVAPLP